jgi:hypothetical protein
MSTGPKVLCRLCLDLIQSKHRHDFESCTCGAISVDGGPDYFRVLGQPENYVVDFDDEDKL